MKNDGHTEMNERKHLQIYGVSRLTEKKYKNLNET